jgi:DNA repair protein RecO (recombination protein O)
MASPTYSATGLVVKRTRLGESDLICTFLTHDGSQIRAVAKGARKPSSPFSSRLELLCIVEALFAKGRNLDVVKEVRLVEGHPRLRTDFERSSAASVMAELIARATDVGTETPNLFAMTAKALSTMEADSDTDPKVIAIAQLLKALALLGFRPSFATCVGCGIDLTGIANLGGGVRFSYTEGGVLCPGCASQHDCVSVDPRVIEWGQALLYSTFDDIVRMDVPQSVVTGLLRLIQQWVRTQLSFDLRSLDFLLSMEINTRNIPDSPLKHH